MTNCSTRTLTIITALTLLCGASLFFVGTAFADDEPADSVSIAPGEVYTYTPEFENGLTAVLTIKYQGFTATATDGEFAEIIEDSLVVTIPVTVEEDATYYVTITATSGVPVQTMDIPIVFAITLPVVDPVDPEEPEHTDPEPTDPSENETTPLIALSGTSVILIVITGLTGAVAIILRRPTFAVVAIVTVVLVALNVTEIISIPELLPALEINFWSR
jgi:hypothetical protein